MPEENYDEEYVINILAEQAELISKYESQFADQSTQTEIKTKLHRKHSKSKQKRHKMRKKEIGSRKLLLLGSKP